MKRAESHQLSFVFADSPQGSEQAKSSDVSEAKAWLLHTANDKEVTESVARADSDHAVSGLLERAASAPNMARGTWTKAPPIKEGVITGRKKNFQLDQL